MIKIGLFMYAHRWLNVTSPIALTHMVIPSDSRTRQLWIRNCTRSEAFNYAAAMAGHVTCDYMLFWDVRYIPDDHKALLLLIQAMEEHDRIDIISPSRGIQRDHIHRVFEGNPGFLLVRTDSLKRLDVPIGDSVPQDGVECAQYFTEDPLSFPRACKAGDVKWYEHGAVTLMELAPIEDADGTGTDADLPRNDRELVWAQ